MREVDEVIRQPFAFKFISLIMSGLLKSSDFFQKKFCKIITFLYFCMDFLNKMTGEQAKILSDFHARVRQVMFISERLRVENSELKEQVAVQKKEIEALTAEKAKLQAQYENLKTARILEVRQGDFARAKKRIDDLVNEIDGCIRLLHG
jgi:predicted  nucleic acid-binding Zn-ribbon protein